MEQFKITVGTGPESEREQFIDVQVTDDPDDFEDDVRGKFEPSPRIVNIDEDGNETEETPEKIGTLKLLREELGAGYVTHEIFHAHSWYLHLLPFSDSLSVEETEEMVAWEFGEWHRQFWEKWRELK